MDILHFLVIATFTTIFFFVFLLLFHLSPYNFLYSREDVLIAAP